MTEIVLPVEFFFQNVLLHGPPGTGKTMLATAVAAEAGATLFVVKPSSINRRFVGESENIIAALYDAVSIVRDTLRSQ